MCFVGPAYSCHAVAELIARTAFLGTGSARKTHGKEVVEWKERRSRSPQVRTTVDGSGMNSLSFPLRFLFARTLSARQAHANRVFQSPSESSLKRFTMHLNDIRLVSLWVLSDDIFNDEDTDFQWWRVWSKALPASLQHFCGSLGLDWGVTREITEGFINESVCNQWN